MNLISKLVSLGFMLATGVSGAEFELLAAKQLTVQNLASNRDFAFVIRTWTPFNATCFDVAVTPKDTGSVAYVTAYWELRDEGGHLDFGAGEQIPTVDEGGEVKAYDFGYGLGRELLSKSRVYFEYWTNSPTGPEHPGVGPYGFVFRVAPRFSKSQIYSGHTFTTATWSIGRTRQLVPNAAASLHGST